MYIYQPKGKAGEYGEYALNLYDGCTHGCKYCYVPAIRYKTPQEYHSKAMARKFNLARLKNEISTHAGKPLFLCFTCDPYQPINDTEKLTSRIIPLCHKNNIPVTILTKGGKRSGVDFPVLAKNPQLSNYGSTLTFLNESDSLEWEPDAALPNERISMLKKAHEMGIPTWASLEPVIDPAQSIEIIKACHGFIDVFKVGRWNHDQRSNLIDWKDFAKRTVEILESVGAKYYIKNDLKKFLD